ncbi:sperm-associated antigen 17-like [Gadus macrocephalus]|uniref:sperm-associated antigen 17-like n=1 Tax=Gadus macrocephalus TaxID=80720 RepID=UPI0028CB4ED2|nr:sperm-associated antigen 17-like [Gadus macrocephalus]
MKLRRSVPVTPPPAGGRGPGGDSEEEVEEAGSVERVVLVEKDGSAQVMVFPERRAAHVFLADGTVVMGDGCGVYQVFPSKAGRLLIGQDGTCIYYPDSTPSSPGSQSGSYRLSTTHGPTCDVTDPEGNRFQVQQSGQVSVVLSAASRASEEEDLTHGEHSPRLFLVHEDGSGTELLHCEEAEPLLKMAPSGPAQLAKERPSAVSMERPSAVSMERPSAVSVVRPAHPPKRDRRIVPLNLRDRSWLNFPIAEMKTLGPPFGSDLGRGLALREGPPVQAPQVQDSPSPPQILQVHELVVYPPPCKRLRETLDSRLEGFRQRLMRREQLSEDMRPLQKIPDAGWERHQRTAAPDLHSDSPEESSRKESERPTETPWAQRRVKHRQELAEDRAQRAALRSRQVVSYFHPENVLLHQKSPT